MGVKDFFKKISGNVLFFPGSLEERELKKEIDNYKEILNRLKINYFLTNEITNSGLTLLNLGYKKDFKKLAEKNFNFLKKNKVYKIITPCPYSYHAFKTLYPSFIKEWNIETQHISYPIYKELIKKRIDLLKKELVSYQDPCYLTRYENEFDTPRKIIEVLGGEIIEPTKTKSEALCCGGPLKKTHESTSKKIAKLRINQFNKNAKKIICSCGVCYLNLSEHDERVTEFSTYVLGKIRGLNIK